MLRHLLLIVTICLISGAVFAQNTQSGTVFENKTRVVLPGVMVENANNGKHTLTDKSGKFIIQAKAGDKLFFTGSFYRPDTLLLTNLNPKEIFLTPKQTTLSEVQVTNIELKTRKGEFTDPAFHGQTVVYHRDQNGNYDGGITVRLHWWDKDNKKKKKQEEFIKDQQIQDEIAKVFSADNIARYVPLKEPDLDNFILLYIPSVKTYINRNFNLASYLNVSYKKYQELPPDLRTAGQLNK
ncbi:MAG: hypothetical protein AAGC65_01415 [Mucilaginibacter sp.]|uniref:hypothetical protein n=1 Tax=Mucilaginibacter sp. TaxID=1882438 RepID=UPI0031B09C22